MTRRERPAPESSPHWDPRVGRTIARRKAPPIPMGIRNNQRAIDTKPSVVTAPTIAQAPNHTQAARLRPSARAARPMSSPGFNVTGGSALASRLGNRQSVNVATGGADDVLREQQLYYALRATEYDDAYRRTGRHDHGAECNDDWHAEMTDLQRAFDAVEVHGDGRQFTIVDHPRPPARIVELFANAGMDVHVETIGRRFCLAAGTKA